MQNLFNFSLFILFALSFIVMYEANHKSIARIDSKVNGHTLRGDGV